MINESAPEDNFKEVLSGLSKDLKFNFGLIFTFGAGIKAMYPIVDNLVRNEALKIDLSVESVLLLTLAGLSITYLEESNNKTGEEMVASFSTKNNNGMKGYAMAVESQIPPTVYKSSNGSSVMTMSQKRSLVVQNYKDMNHNRFKITKPVKSKSKSY
jgi:hypothetical protein